MSSCYSGYDDRSFEFDDSSFDSGYEKSFETDCLGTKRRLCFESGTDFYPALDAPASTGHEQSQFLALLDTNSNQSSRSGKTLAEHLISKTPLLDVDATNPFAPKLGVQTSTPTKKTPGEAAPTEPRPKRKYAVGKNRVTRSRSPMQVVRIKKFRRMKANDRERNRMHTLNDALERLRVTLPSLPEETKLTKIEILRFAHNYIFALEQVLQSGNTINLDLEKLQNFTLSGERITKEIFDALFVNPPPYHLMAGSGYTMSPTRIALLQQQQQHLLHPNQRPHQFPPQRIQQAGFGAPDLYNGQYGTGAMMTGPNQEDFGPHYSAEKHQIFRSAFEAAANVKMPALNDYTRQQSPSQYGGMDPNYVPHLPSEQQIQAEFASQARPAGTTYSSYTPGIEESPAKPHQTGIHHSSSFYSQTPPWKDYSEQMANTQHGSFGQFPAL